MAAPVAVLPVEVIDCVAESLQLEDLRSLRLTCKAMAEKSSYSFQHRYCSKANTNLSLSSVQKMDDFSRCTWANGVKTLWLDWDEDAGRGFIWDRDEDQSIRADMPVVRQLRQILMRFVNCEAMYIRAPYEHDFIVGPEMDRLGCSDLLGLGFLLIAESRVRLQKLDIEFGTETGKCRVKSQQAHLEQLWRPEFKQALGTVRELSIRLAVEEEKGSDWTWSLVCQAGELERLEWRVQHSERIYFQPVRVGGRVQELMLQHMYLTEANLMEVLGGCRGSVRKVGLFQIGLRGSWRRMLYYLEGFSRLESISIGFLREGYGASGCWQFSGIEEKDGGVGRIGGTRVKIREKGVVGQKRVVGVEYRGPRMRDVVKLLREGMIE